MSVTAETRERFAAWNRAVATNFYEADPHLRSLLVFHDRLGIEPQLRTFGAVAAEIDPLVRENNRDENLPRLRRWDDQGRKIEKVDFHPTYHEIGRKVYASGAMGLYREPGRELETAALGYLFSQNGEAGHLCPMACTAGLIKILQRAGDAPAEWLERLYDPDYDTHFHGAQFLTEVQGGSDVGVNAVEASEGQEGWRLYGEKWFCSVIDAHLFVVTARPGGAGAGTPGVRAFAVPRYKPDGTINDFSIRRLKYKLGTRSMASAEIDLEGAWGWPVGDFRQTVEIVLNTSRLFNAIATSGMMQRAWREAHEYARTRVAFGRPIIGFPTLARIVARLRSEAYAARGLTFLLAQVSDRMATGASDEVEAPAWRMLVNLNKFWTAWQSTSAIRDAIEVLGGNGAIEEFSVLPRLLRDSIVCEQWEGPHNVLCAQVYRDSKRLGLHEPMFAFLERTCGKHPRLDEARARWDRLLALPQAEAQVHIRDVAEELRPVVQALVLAAEARAPGTDPLLPVVVDHLLATSARGYDPLDDAGLSERVRALVS